MRSFFISAIFTSIVMPSAFSDEVVLSYRAFGPQVFAHEVIGQEWWQWDTTGNKPDQKYSILVVVYWEQSLLEVMEKYPVVQEEKKDFRYLSRDEALKYLDALSKRLRFTGDS